MSCRLILVGGFLGAGKTTLLAETAHKLSLQGLKVGLITNDQATNLVDTRMLVRSGAGVAEVSGSCFCCNFQGLLDAMDQLKKTFDADIVLAEPVGSCTDLSATIIQPLKDKLQSKLLISPLTVLADPIKLGAILAGGTAGLHDDAAYIYRKQLEEADLILISKVDLLTLPMVDDLLIRVRKAFPSAIVQPLSAERNVGLDYWLDHVLHKTTAGNTLLDIDYDRYAEGEAVLGWLNARFELRTTAGTWRTFAEAIMTRLHHQFAERNLPIGHVKLIVESESQVLFANLTGTEIEPKIRGEMTSTLHATMTINARVETSPEELRQIIWQALQQSSDGINVYQEQWNCLKPGRPEPTYRYSELVA